MNLLFDPHDPSMRTDPYPGYQRLRETDPVHRSPFGYWVLSRYDDVSTLLRSATVSSEFPKDPTWARLRGGQGSPVVASARKWMLMLDGAPHRRIRRLIGRAFNAAVIERLRAQITTVVGDLFDQLGTGRVDLIRGLALPLPIAVICRLLGLPTVDLDQHPGWTDRIGRLADPVITRETQVAVNKAEREFGEFITEQLELRRAHPTDDIMSLLLTAEADGERLTDFEIVANVLLLFDTGHETAVNLVGNGLLALLRHPDQLELLRAEPELIETGIDELARYDPPVQLAARIATEDIAVRGKTIPAGAMALLLLGAANRDPAKYPDPDRLDLTRTGVKTLAFGAGPHYCIGAMLGKLEASLVLTELLQRYRTIELATEDLTWHPHFNMRGLTELPLRLAA